MYVQQIQTDDELKHLSTCEIPSVTLWANRIVRGPYYVLFIDEVWQCDTLFFTAKVRRSNRIAGEICNALK